MLGYMPTINTDLLNDRFEKVRHLTGDFHLVVYNSIQHTLGWVKTGEGSSSITYDNSFIKEIVKVTMGAKRINMNNTLACDIVEDSYKLMTSDDTTGIMDVYQGNISEGILTFCNTSSEKERTNENEDSFCLKLIYKRISSKENELIVGRSKDKGKTWFPHIKTVYKRIDTI